MLSFASDYIAGAHPEILKRLVETNLVSQPGYGSDEYCQSAAAKIKEAVGRPDAEVFFLVGGTQTNQTVITTMIDNNEGVIAAETGHVSTHEAGAIEHCGHKVITLPQENGKIKASSISEYVKVYYENESFEHCVFPGMVYISFPTEYGTIYSKKELEDIYSACKENSLPLFIDGARLGYGLESYACDMTLKDIAALCDVFYIGGTKVGALCGEAVVYTHGNAPKRFIGKMKQHGALLAKGRLLGVQFDTLFTDNLYLNISKHAIDMAELIKKVFSERGYSFFIDSPTNQQFIILDNKKMAELRKDVDFSYWEKYDDDHTVVRFATSWSTTEEDIKALEALLDR
ncbi:MAG: low specificity L-threonine aldolase [Eubacteriales bacterium]|nr:low specificity L-threonine aldolase [Eubacteriales bacterium]